MRLSIRWSHPVSLRGLPISGWVAVVPNHFRFIITPLTVDCGIFREEEISRLDLLHRWHPITVPCWDSLSSWERPILSQLFVETVYMPRCLLLYTCGHGSDWNTWFQLFGWVSEYFWQYSVCAAYSPRGSTSRQSLNCDGISSANMGQKVTSSFQYFELWSSTSWESMYKQEYGHRQPLLCRIHRWILCKADSSNTWMACSNQWPQRFSQPIRPYVQCKCKSDSSSERCSCRAKELACTDDV